MNQLDDVVEAFLKLTFLKRNERRPVHVEQFEERLIHCELLLVV